MKRHPLRRHDPRRSATDGDENVALAPVTRSRPRPRAPRTTSAPRWQTVLAAIAGGGISAAVGGLVVNQKLLSPEAVGLGLMLGGGATAYFGGGHTRVVGTSMAAAGAGQFALAVMARKAIKKSADQGSETKPANHNAPLPAEANTTAPPPPVPPPRTSASGGLVVDLFRDAALDLDTVEDEWRYGVRDHHVDPRDAAEPYAIDLDEVA